MPIRENPLSGHLLRALLALLEEASVTRAAQRLNLSQPATSLILKQLRGIFGDPLLVRGQGGMVRTERAEMLRRSASQALLDFDALLVRPDDFDPSESRQTFTIAMPDHILPLMLNGVMREFRRQAPLARLAIRALGPEYDFEDQFVCLVDSAHRFTRHAPTSEDYLAADHVAPSDYAIMQRGVVETHLSGLRLTRERRVVTSYFSMAPYLLPGTDLVFTVTRHYAEHFVEVLPLAIVDCPIDYPLIRFYQLWHERAQHSPTHRWLRTLVGEVRRFRGQTSTS